MTATQTKTIQVIYLYNLGFFGGNREGALTIDGQYKAYIDGNEFVLVKLGGYGNLTSFPKVEKQEAQKLTDADYRYAHDAILRALERDRASEASPEIFETAEYRYKLHKTRISKNIDYGDTVVDLRNNETFVVNSNHDLKYIQRDFFYKLVREVEHPEPATLQEVIKATEAKNPFEGWTKLDAEPKKHKDFLYERYIIDGQIYKVIKDYSGNGRYIITTPAGEVYEKKSNISAPFYDTIDLLVGHLYSEYNIGSRTTYIYKDVVHEVDSKVCLPDRFTKTTLPASYHYNKRLTHL